MNSSEYRKTVFLNVDFEDDVWCVTSPTLPSLFAGGESLEEARSNARQVVAEELGTSVSVVEWLPVPYELRAVVGRSNTTNDLPVENLTPGSWRFEEGLSFSPKSAAPATNEGATDGQTEASNPAS